jgi:hypothetical protein
MCWAGRPFHTSIDTDIKIVEGSYTRSSIGTIHYEAYHCLSSLVLCFVLGIPSQALQASPAPAQFLAGILGLGELGRHAKS